MEHAAAALALAGWLEDARGRDGFGGPVAHWWRDCLVDCRAGHDWRYEGIMAGYLALHATVGDPSWLARARRAGDDLLAAQDDAGHFSRSCFELNPGVGGTPHEAAADTALLRLAAALAPTDPSAAGRYRAAARTNVDRCLVARLWDPGAQAFRDTPNRRSFVPNKSCTAIEALLLLAEATGDDRYVEQYAVPTARAVLRHQVRRPGSRLDGAIAQNSFDGEPVRKYFPYYVARCVPGLLAVHRSSGDAAFADAALAAGRFVLRWRDPDGALPQVVYDDERVNRFPRWVAAAGDILRAVEALRPFGLDADTGATEAWLRDGLLANGGIMTARGFAAQASSQPPRGPPELRDLLTVAGWADKAFRYFAERAGAAPHGGMPAPAELEAECSFAGRRLTMRAQGAAVEVRQGRTLAYRWRPEMDRPDVLEPWLAAR